MLATDQIRHWVEQKAGSSVLDLRPFAAGNNTLLYLIDLRSGARLVAKVARREDARLDIEAWMLKYLRDNSELPVPEVFWSQKNILVMSYLADSGTLDASAETSAAELLAALHRIRGPFYGLEKHTLIGPLHQPNTPSRDWTTFFRDHRLLHMARAALEEGRIDGALMKSVEKLAGKLGDYIDDPAPPSLLHGDIWSANVLSLPGRITGFIDPAIYYGDPEMDLAFATLFNTFGPDFFKRYGEITPVRDGFFEVRKDLYNLYPLLVHVRLFGGPYVGVVKQILQRFAP